MACLNLIDSFCCFDKKKFIRLTQFYQNEFIHVDLLVFEYQLENFFVDICQDERFCKLQRFDNFSMKLIELCPMLVCFNKTLKQPKNNYDLYQFG